MLSPSESIKRSTGLTRLASLFLRRTSAERLMNTTAVVVAVDFLQLPPLIERIPEEQAIHGLLRHR